MEPLLKKGSNLVGEAVHVEAMSAGGEDVEWFHGEGETAWGAFLFVDLHETEWKGSQHSPHHMCCLIIN